MFRVKGVEFNFTNELTYYQELAYKKGLCLEAERVYNKILSIHLYPLMKDEDVRDVVAAKKGCCVLFQVVS